MTDSPGQYHPSPQALRTLRETFWSPEGWRSPRAWPEPGAMAEAVEAGVMFAGPVLRDHDGWVRAAREAARRVSVSEVGEAFLVSLGSRRLDLRSALGSCAVGRQLPEHAFTSGDGRGHCQVRGLWWRVGEDPLDMNELSFERFRWGGVAHDSIPYIAFDLEQFARAPRPDLREDDVVIGRRLISFLRGLPAETTAAQAAPQLTMIKGNNAERGVLMQILGLCGILRTTDHPGYADSFVPYSQRAEPPLRFPFRRYPIWWWTAAYGVNDDAIRLFLPQI